MKKCRKRIISLSLSFILASGLFVGKREFFDDPKITINSEIDDDTYFESCSCGDVYIGNSYEINELINNNVDGIFVIDERYREDPNMKVIDSYNIISRYDMKSVLKILNDYESLYPSKWNRTITSMANEWFVHNYFYRENKYITHSKDVDLNNEDENVYKEFNLYKLYKKRKDL